VSSTALRPSSAGGVLSESRRLRIVSGIDPLPDGGIVAAAVVAEHRAIQARLRVDPEGPDGLRVGHRALHDVVSITRAEVGGHLGTDAVVEVVGTSLPASLHRQRAVLGEPVAITEPHRDPVVAAVRRLGRHLVSLDEGGLPEELSTHARTEARVEADDREDPSLVVRAEGEEVEDRAPPVVLLRHGGDPTDRRPDHVVGHQVRGEENHPRAPDQDVTGRRRRRRLAPVVRRGPLRLTVRERRVRGRRLLPQRRGWGRDRIGEGLGCLEQEQHQGDDPSPAHPAEAEKIVLTVQLLMSKRHASSKPSDGRCFAVSSAAPGAPGEFRQSELCPRR
jgi:hypothetical protein